MQKQPIVVFVTAPSNEVGRQIAHALVEAKLAACVNILPAMQSIYTWEGAILAQSEVLLVIKSMSDIFQDRLLPAVKALHPYKVPEIIALPIVNGLPAYLSWIDHATV